MSEECTCQIEIDNCNYDPCTILSTRKPVAKKEHKCSECGKTIKVRQQYCKENGVLNGEFIIIKTCLDCLSIRDNLFCSYVFGSLYDDLQNEINNCDIPEACIAKLMPRAQEMVCEMIEDSWNED